MRKYIAKYYINHTHILATFRDHVKLELPKVSQTIFASRYTLLRHLRDCREQLITTICLSKWKHLVKNADDAIRAKVADIMKKGDFWDEVGNNCANETINRKIMKIASKKHPTIGLKALSLI